MKLRNNTRRDFLKTAGFALFALPEALHFKSPPAPAEGDLRLWYRKPAADWNEALPIGNGRLGAMVFGGIHSERLQLNEDTLYSDEPGRGNLDLDVRRDFDRVLSMIKEKRYAEAEASIRRQWLGRVQPCYQPLGDLHLHFPGQEKISDYVRELNLREAMCRIHYRQDGVTFRRELFASFPAQAIIMRLSASVPGSLNLRIDFSCEHPTAKVKVEGADQLILSGQAPGFVLRRTLDWVEQNGEQHKYPEVWDSAGKRRAHAKQILYGEDIDGLGMRFEARLRAQVKNGRIAAEDRNLQIERADQVLLVLTAATSFNGFDKSPSRQGKDPSKQTSHHLRQAFNKTYEQLRSDHLKDYTSLFDRVSLELPSSPQSALPTDERIEKFGNDQDAPLAALYFQFGRYLMIAGSRPGTQPLNLQGLWNPHVVPPWAGAYTLNINAEMNYWPAETANLSECHEPLLRMIQELAANGKRVAARMYGKRGWVAHHNTTIWRGAQPVDGAVHWAFWPMAAGWLSLHLWEHYEFTGDRAFLGDKAYPLMKGAAEFFLDWLVEDQEGYLVTPMGTSPENQFMDVEKEGREQIAAVSMGPTMDIAIIHEAFQNCIRAAGELKTDLEFCNEIQEKLKKLPPYRIGSQGQLQEWRHDFKEQDPHHRHISHLYGLHPGSQITRRGTPALSEAARRTLELRGDEGTGWSRAWKIAFWARMEDGNHAYKLIRNLLQSARTGDIAYDGGGVMPNLFCSHPPFQIDGNFGGTAGIAEMLLQSHAGELHLLPALPDAWPQGSARGLCARGGFVVDVAWQNGTLTAAKIFSKLGKACRVRYREKTIELTTEAGGSYRLMGDLKIG